jgi:hypothetical protein
MCIDYRLRCFHVRAFSCLLAQSSRDVGSHRQLGRTRASSAPPPGRHAVSDLQTTQRNRKVESYTKQIYYLFIFVSIRYTTLDFAGLVLDYFLGQFSVVGKNVSRFVIGDRMSGLTLSRQFDAWAQVMLSLANPSKKRSTESLDVTEDNLSVIDGKVFVGLIFCFVL